jgi:hypothetical protein
LRTPKSQNNYKEQKKAVTVEWVIADDEREWQLAQSADLVTSAPPRNQWRNWWMVTAATLLFLSVASGWLWYQAEIGLDKIEGELQAAVEVSQWQMQRDSQMIAGHTGVIQEIGERVGLPRVSHLEILDLGNEWAIVQVTTRQQESSYRQTILYRRDANGWYAATPSAAVWGAPRTLETTYFVFHYYALDNAAVVEAASKLDTIYPGLTASFPLDPASASKRHILISPYFAVEGTFNKTSYTTLKIASPALYLSPTEISEGDILAQAVLMGLLEVFFEQSLYYLLPTASHDYQVIARVYLLLETLRLWQLWNTDLPLATLHKPTIQWLYSDVQDRRTLLAFDTKLCSLHQLWGAAPRSIQIPLFCGDPQQLERYELWRYFPLTPPRSLGEFNLFYAAMPNEPSQVMDEDAPVGLATLFDYAATTYGPQTLPLLIRNATTHSTWKALIPATFGVSRTEFERGWQAYLYNHYGVSSAVTP